MTVCDHEWTHALDARGCPYWLCGRCGVLADEWVMSRGHRCGQCGGPVGRIPAEPYILRGPSATWGRCYACDCSIRLDLCPRKDPQTALEDFA